MTDNRGAQRALEILLSEELGGHRPPDLESRILAAAARRQVELPPPPAESTGAVGRGRSVGFVLSSAVGAAAAALILAFWPESSSGEKQITGVVTRGQIEWIGTHSRVVAAAGEALRIQPCVRDRLISARDENTHLTLNRLGTLRCAPATILEVTDMEWKEFGGGAVAGAITLSVIVGAVRWSNGGDDVSAATGSEIVIHDSQSAADLRGATADLRDELGKARKRIADLEVQVARRPQPAVETPPPEVTFDALLSRSGYDEALASVNWKVVGHSIAGYLKARRKVLALEKNGEDVPYELRAAMDRWEGQLFAEIGQIIDETIPGLSMTAKAHHPGIGLNLLAAGLSAMGKPLTTEQRKTLGALTQRFVGEDLNRRDSYGDEAFDLERLVGEAEMTGRFFKEARGLLRGDQESLLSFGDLDDRARTDPLGPGFQWSRMDRVVEVGSRDELAAVVGRGFGKDLGLSDAQIAKLRPLVVQWAQDTPSEWLDIPMDSLDRSGSNSIRRLRAMVGPQLKLMRDIAAMLDLTPAQLAKLRKTGQIILPFLRK